MPIEYGLRPTPTCQPVLLLYVVVLTWTRLIPVGIDTSRSYTAGSIGMAALYPHNENQHAASDVAAPAAPVPAIETEALEGLAQRPAAPTVPALDLGAAPAPAGKQRKSARARARATAE